METRIYTEPDQFDALGDQWARLKEEHPRLRIREAAAKLGVSEAELLATQIGESVTPLRPEFKTMFEAFPKLGTIMASTRNEWAVIEKTGQFDNVELGKFMGVVLDPNIDLRVFLTRFKYAFAVVNHDHPRGPLRSFQFFDEHGDSIHKVYVKKGGNVEDWIGLVEYFRADSLEQFEIAHPDEPASPEPKTAEDIGAFQEAWRNLQDTHDFFPMLREHGFQRVQALENAPEGFAYQVDNDAVTAVLQKAAERQLPIMVFVGSRGLIEIHTGPVNKIVEMDTWINVLDPEFNLHLQRAGVAQTWVVKKPTEDGIVTSVELFDQDGGTIAMLFGERKPGIPELESWRELVAELAAA